MICPPNFLRVVRGVADHVGHNIRVREHRDVTALDLPYRGSHAFRGKALQLGLDGGSAASYRVTYGGRPDKPFLPRLVGTDYCTVEASAVWGIDGNVAGDVWRVVGGERRPALQIRGGLNDVIHVDLSSQRELKLTT